ncbi:MAG: glucosaminidase domain-containing protein [Candidatus Daviesbacteria bacterium]|nr:MAG: glucosaminidase domain-containing protein [Candidatus Daviesbacteria bacterium]
MDKQTTLVASWFGTSFTSLIFSLILLMHLSTAKYTPVVSHDFKLYSALPAQNTVVSDAIVHTDARAKIIEDFFLGYKSVLTDYANEFIKVADKYQLDWRLLPAIAMQESNGGKRVIANSYNPFGYGIYGNNVRKFPSWEEAIQRVGQALREDYVNLGLKTPEEIMTKYTPPSLGKDGAWAKGVRSFMLELQ